MRARTGAPSLLGRRRNGEGFSILDLLLALLVISLTATASIWAYFSRAEVTLDNAVRLLAQDLRIAQNRAAVLHAPVSMVFAPDGEGYRVVGGAGEAPPSGKDPGVISRRYSRDAIFEGVRISDLDLGPGRLVVFDALGFVTTGGRITLSFRGESRTIEIASGSGMIHILDMSTPWEDGAR